MDSIYASAIAAFGAAGLDLVSDTLKVVLCTSAYTADVDADLALDDIPSGARKATATLSGKSFTAGVFDADNPVFSSVAAGSSITQAVIYKHTGTESTSTLVYRIDSYAGMPLTTDGTDITLAWPDDGNKIFKIGA